MLEYITAVGPVIIALIIYFVRLETRLTEIRKDLCWIKKELENCPQS